MTIELSNEQAANELKAMQEHVEPYMSVVGVTAYNMAIKALEQTRWIPVSERLPGEREWYLAVFKEKDTGFQLIPRIAGYIGQGENKWQRIDDYSFSQEYFDLLECVAWMPLPQPYKEVKADE